MSYIVQPRIEDLLRLSAAANAVDIAAPWYPSFDLVEELDNAAVTVRGSIDRAVKLLKTACSVAMVLDNAGEAVIDLMLALSLANQGYRVYVVARSEPYELDATASEVRKLLADVARVLGLDTKGVEVVETGSRYPAPARGRVSKQVERLLKGSDLVLSKGIANLEAFIDYGFDELEKVVLAVKAKCLPIARVLCTSMGVPMIRILDEVLEVYNHG